MSHARVPSQSAGKMINQLEANDDIQARIDIVARDYQSKRRKYAVIDAWTLGELGIDFETAGDHGRVWWGYRARLEDCCDDFPFAEYIELLQGLVPPKRYAKLEQQAHEIVSTKPPHDLRLTKREQELFEEAYAKKYSSREGVQTAM